MGMADVPQRGDLYRVSLRGDANELRGPHFVVIVSDEIYNHLSTVVVVPFSSHTRPAELHPETSILGRRTRAMVEQVRVLTKQRLGQYVGTLSGTGVMGEIDQQLRQLLALGQDHFDHEAD
ncbi:MAG: type II toxin-antitoxin system PemK/MazF family toxin [Chloroflexi bacterium]|nr:type II toxin-antitoxin system PemK/MazF family toxin [Chloroflexota bacterium]